jgi:hypothetical protein
LAVAFSSPLVASADQPKPPFEVPKEPEWKLQQHRKLLFDEGQKLVEQEKWREALDKFREVQRLRIHPRVMLWMALCEDHLGNLLKAHAIYAQALLDAHDTRLADVEEDATKALAALEPRIPRLVVRAVPPLEVFVMIDSTRIRLENGRSLVDPGKHTVVVGAPGRKSFHTELLLKPGEEKILTAPLPAAPSEGPDLDPSESGPATGSMIFVVVGGTAAATGAIFTGLGYGGDNDGFRAPGIGLLIGGGIALAAGIPWAVISARKAAAKPSVSFSATPLPGGAAIGARGSF